MKFKAVTEHNSFRPALGAALAALCGLALWAMPLGEGWENASYDYLFRFSARAVTNKVVLILMDNEAHNALRQERGQWNRDLHAQLLQRLTDDGCPLVVFDVFFERDREPKADGALTEAIRRHGRVVLAVRVNELSSPRLDHRIFRLLPAFEEAAAAWGIGKVGADTGEIVRRHWPFPAWGGNEYVSLSARAAQLAGAPLNDKPRKQWLRYYGEIGPWAALSYHQVSSIAPGYFRDKTVFIGNKPELNEPTASEKDKFSTPYTSQNGRAVGGVEIIATQFLNLMNNDWLRRPAGWIEALLLVVVGVLLGGGMTLLRPLSAVGIALGTALAVTLGVVFLSYYSNFWFPWLIIAGGQVPCALVWSLVSQWRGEGTVSNYEVAKEPFGKGAYGEVFLARHRKNGEWFAFKRVYRAKFSDPTPYEREFRGITRYLPVSSQHPGLLHVHYVGRDEGASHFFYVMDLGDAQTSGWERNPALYRPRDLKNACAEAEQRRLPVRECVEIGLKLTEALEFLHQHDLIHRDIKPSNIIFVKNQPKLADVGLIAEVRPSGAESSWVGTPEYMPPVPEPPGTVQADIYALGLVLYVISTGSSAALFPELPMSVVEETGAVDFMRLNAIILKACHPDLAQRYASAQDMRAALREAQEAAGRAATTKRMEPSSAGETRVDP